MVACSLTRSTFRDEEQSAGLSFFTSLTIAGANNSTVTLTMAILDSLEILLEDATSQQVIPKFDTEKISEETTVRQVIKCISVVDG
jgi:hypothetical protein